MFRTICLTVMSVLFIAAQVDARITQVDSLCQVKPLVDTDTVVLIDIDDTLIDSQGMVGSKTWRHHIKKAGKNHDREHWHDIFTLHIARYYPMGTVETCTADFLRGIQEQGITVFGFTARERNLWYTTPVEGIDDLTVRQLASVGLDFGKSLINQSYKYLESYPEFYKGIFFVDTELKGDYLSRILNDVDTSKLPKKVIFIDDKKSQVESMEEALEGLGIEHESYWYCATDAKAKQFNPLIADIQLYYLLQFGKIVTNEEAEMIAAINTDRSPSFYLEALLHDW